jgi:predicted nucleotidyltransferase
LIELGNSLTSIIFFGSRQRGEFTSDSDIDMLIVIKEKNYEDFIEYTKEDAEEAIAIAEKFIQKGQEVIEEIIKKFPS